MSRVMGPEGPHQLDLAMGRRLRERRRELGMSQQELAEAVGITFQQLQKYERGVNRISFSRLAALAGALRCRIRDLVDELEAEQPEPMADEVARLLKEPGAIKLLESYAALSSSELQRMVLRHVRDLADYPAPAEPQS